MSEILGMHWTLALTIISIVLMIVDLFIFQGGGLTFLSDLFFTFIVLHFIPTDNWIWLSLWFIIIFSLVLALHFSIYKKIVKYFIDKIIAPTKHKDIDNTLIGKIGKICWIEERGYIYIENEYIPCMLENGFLTKENALKKAKVISWNKSGELYVAIID